MIKPLPEIICPWCVKQGGLYLSLKLQAHLLTMVTQTRQMRLKVQQVPELFCTLCDNTVKGWTEGTGLSEVAVFPDPHSQGPGQSGQ